MSPVPQASTSLPALSAGPLTAVSRPAAVLVVFDDVIASACCDRHCRCVIRNVRSCKIEWSVRTCRPDDQVGRLRRQDGQRAAGGGPGPAPPLGARFGLHAAGRRRGHRPQRLLHCEDAVLPVPVIALTAEASGSGSDYITPRGPPGKSELANSLPRTVMSAAAVLMGELVLSRVIRRSGQSSHGTSCLLYRACSFSINIRASMRNLHDCVSGVSGSLVALW